MQRYFRLKELTNYVKISRASIFRLLRKGEFPQPIRLGQRLLIWDKVEIDKWMIKRYKQQRQENV